MIKESNAHKIIKISMFFILSVITVLILYPLLFVLTTSFKTYGDFMENPFSISFAHPENWAVAWVRGNFSKYFLNSVIVATFAVCVQVIASALAAFTLGVLKPKGHSVILFALLSTMFVTTDMTGIPMVILVRELGLYDSLGALIFPILVGPPSMGAYMAVNYINKIPKELHESFIMDGASIFKTFLFLDLPLLRPILVLVAIMCFNGSWSDFFWPLITIPTNDSARTLPLGLINFQSQNSSEFGVLCAGLCILTIPIILFYSFNSKYFIEGVSAGAVKG